MRFRTAALSLLVIFIFIESVFINTGISDPNLELKATTKDGDGIDVEITYELTATQKYADFNLICFPVSQYRNDTIYLFEDPKFTDVDLARSIYGLYDHLRAELRLLGAENDIRVVSLAPLLEIFSGDPATVILAGGIPNATNFALSALNWVEKGGVLITLGNQSIPFLAKVSQGSWVGEEVFLRMRFQPIAVRYSDNLVATPIAEAFDFKATAPMMGIFVEDVQRYGGQIIGYYLDEDKRLASLAFIPIGKGVLLAFSGPITAPYLTSSEDAIACDIARIIVSQLPWISGEIQSKNLAGIPREINGTVRFHFEEAHAISVFAFSRLTTMPIYARVIVEIHGAE